LLFVPMDWVSHLTPSLLSRQLLTNVQVNNITTLHDTHKHTYIHTSHRHYYSSSSLLDFFHPSWQAGWPRPFPTIQKKVTQCFLIWFMLTANIQNVQYKEWPLTKCVHCSFISKSIIMQFEEECCGAISQNSPGSKFH
jgi:hypothetical protein